MKTPKRHIELTTMTHDGLEMVWDNSQWNVSTQRWKRKNRVKQLKRTIARLEKEKVSAYHKGHKDGYDLAFARSWF